MPWAPDNQEIAAVFERVADLLGVGERLERDGWSFTAMFSNRARAHALGKTGDWVVLFAERDGEEDRATVVTESAGALARRRVVRGREAECLDFYAASAAG